MRRYNSNKITENYWIKYSPMTLSLYRFTKVSIIENTTLTKLCVFTCIKNKRTHKTKLFYMTTILYNIFNTIITFITVDIVSAELLVQLLLTAYFLAHGFSFHCQIKEELPFSLQVVL